MTTDLLTAEALRPEIELQGFELVDLQLAGSAARRLVRIRIDVPGGGSPGHGVTTDDCRRVSRALEQILEGQGAVGPAWTIEVSSPGIERPIRYVDHWRRYVGQQVKIKAAGVSGRQVATIVSVEGDDRVVVDISGQRQTLPLDTIKEATLVVDWSSFG